MWVSRKCALVLAISAVICIISGHAMAWSWTNDAKGEKMHREARHWLTTQNLCGVQLRGSYLSKLDKHIISHFGSMADSYRSYLIWSVLSANADYLDANPEIFDKEKLVMPTTLKNNCEKRVPEAVKAGVLANPKARPYQWSASEIAFEKPQSWKGWEGDAKGEGLDKESRQWLTTQYLCGVELRENYVSDLDQRILSHFGEKADAYRAYLLASMGHENVRYLQDADPVDVKKECKARVAQALKAGMLSNIKSLPFQWSASMLDYNVYK